MRIQSAAWLAEMARNRAALFSRDKVSARNVGFNPVFSSAARTASFPKRGFRLFQRVFRLWPKDVFRKSMKAASGTCNFSSRGATVSRTTVEWTLGGGENAPGGKVNNFSILA